MSRSSSPSQLSVILGWQKFLERPVQFEELSGSMRDLSPPRFSFYLMLSLATAIATFGMLANSAPTIIGAMIIAPLMAPILSLAFGLVCSDWRMTLAATFSVITGTMLVIVFAFICTEMIGLRIAGSEILGRSSPTLLDLGVALAAGAAGAFAYTRTSIMNSIAGVAIAVALVPPLAVVGIGLSLGYKAAGDADADLREIGIMSGGFDIAQGAFVLFLTNLIGIIATAAIVFALSTKGRWRNVIAGFFIFLILLIPIFGPLSDGLYRLYVKSTVNRALVALVVLKPDLYSGHAKVNRLNVDNFNDRVHVNLDVTIDSAHLSKMPSQVATLQKYLSAALGKKVELRATVLPVDVKTFVAISSEDDEDIDDKVLEEIN